MQYLSSVCEYSRDASCYVCALCLAIAAYEPLGGRGLRGGAARAGGRRGGSTLSGLPRLGGAAAAASCAAAAGAASGAVAATTLAAWRVANSCCACSHAAWTTELTRSS